MESVVAWLPHINALLNLLSVCLLVFGYWLIRHGREQAHKRTMLSCFGVSVLFFICYLTYHQLLFATTGERGKAFEYPGLAVRYFYYAILVSHVILAAIVPFLAVGTIWFGLKDRRRQHRRLARWTFPIWLYVSVTGVVVYLMLYQL